MDNNIQSYSTGNIEPINNPPPPGVLKKNFRKKVSTVSGGLLIYTVIMFVIVIFWTIACSIAAPIIAGIKGETYDAAAFNEKFLTTDAGMSLGVICGCLFMTLFNMKNVKPKEIFRNREQQMTPLKFVMLVCVLMSVQLPFSLFDNLFEYMLNSFGLTAQAAIESSKAGSESVSMMLYAGFIGPFAEEYIYRGHTMQTLEKTGACKGYALIISSILFGVMHGNPTQSVYAFFAGMVFGYTAIEFGVIWSITLHIMNNFLFGDVLVFLMKDLDEDTSDIISFMMLLLFFAAGILVLVIKWKTVVNYVKKNYRTGEHHYTLTFTNIFFLTFVIINILLAVSQIKEYVPET